MVGVQGFSLSPGSFSVPRERSPRSAESSKELGQKMHMYTHVSVSEAFKELPRDTGKGRASGGLQERSRGRGGDGEKREEECIRM